MRDSSAAPTCILIPSRSNIVFLIGTNYGERLMYGPSLGFCLAIAVLLVRGFRTDESTVTVPIVGAFFRTCRGPLVVLALVVTLYGFETVTRNADWYDNLTLFAKDLQRAPGNAHLHYSLGQHLLKKALFLPATGDGAARKALLTEAITEQRKVVELYPEFSLALGNLALAHWALGDTATARTYLEHARRLEPSRSVFQNNSPSSYSNWATGTAP